MVVQCSTVVAQYPGEKQDCHAYPVSEHKDSLALALCDDCSKRVLSTIPGINTSTRQKGDHFQYANAL